jgi:hypothetical protein
VGLVRGVVFVHDGLRNATTRGNLAACRPVFLHNFSELIGVLVRQIDSLGLALETELQALAITFCKYIMGEVIYKTHECLLCHAMKQ